jgi:hypothetical protein
LDVFTEGHITERGSSEIALGIIAVCVSVLAARKLATVPRNSLAYIAALADAVADAKRIVERIESETRRR